ncbi:GTP binding protein Cdc42 [Favolaschia claudopus]|uniref:GTP binding protein Cdc42 n=1 Tax=Favolaschia claudopus TaxID=2862362 RepID=A0AAW0CZI5_9AGAR
MKLVVVGDNRVGKTSLLISHTTGKFPMDYTPTVFDGYAINIMVGTQTYCLGYFDTAGQAEYDRLRPLSYPQTDAFLVCFSVGMLESLKNIRNKWFPELHHYCPRVPRIMVATKIDLRNEEQTLLRMHGPGQIPVTSEQGERLARELGATKYVECSAKTLEGVANVFDEAINAMTESSLFNQRRRGRCIVL